MTDRPILFSGPMVQALLDGRKTQTRRVIKLADDLTDKTFTGKLVSYYGDERLGMQFENTSRVQPIPYNPGDCLWVRETWAQITDAEQNPQAGRCLYRSDARDNSGVRWPTVKPGDPDREVKWRPSIFMPRWASRLTLTVTDVRVQRVQEISGEDAEAEGIYETWPGGWDFCRNETAFKTARAAFRDLWSSLNAKRGYGWDENPWVSATTFTVHHCNIDQMESAA